MDIGVVALVPFLCEVSAGDLSEDLEDATLVVDPLDQHVVVDVELPDFRDLHDVGHEKGGLVSHAPKPDLLGEGGTD